MTKKYAIRIDPIEGRELEFLSECDVWGDLFDDDKRAEFDTRSECLAAVSMLAEQYCVFGMLTPYLIESSHETTER